MNCLLVFVAFGVLLLLIHGSVFADTLPGEIIVPGADTAQGKRVMARLKSTIMPKFDSNQLPLKQVIAYLNAESKKLDPQHRGVTFRLEIPTKFPLKAVSLTLSESSLEELLDYVCAVTDLAYKIENETVVLFPGQLHVAPDPNALLLRH